MNYPNQFSKSKPDIFDRIEKHPIRNIILMWLGVTLLNIVIWGAGLAAVLFLVKAIFF